MTGLAVDTELLPEALYPEWEQLSARLVAAGYAGEFKVLGAGMTSIVLTDGERALKVARLGAEETIADEHEYLVAMQPELAAHFPAPIGFDSVAHVLVREVIEGRRGGWGTRGLREVYEHVVRASRANQWTEPEYKEDSFIITDSGRIVMVDVGFANRIGERHAQHIEALLDGGHVPTEQDARDWAWGLRMDAPKYITPERAAVIQARLEALVGKDLS